MESSAIYREKKLTLRRARTQNQKELNNDIYFSNLISIIRVTYDDTYTQQYAAL